MHLILLPEFNFNLIKTLIINNNIFVVPPANVKLTGPQEARKGDTVTFMCSTDVSNPASQITWIVDGSRVVGGESITKKFQDGWMAESNLTITLTRQVISFLSGFF